MRKLCIIGAIAILFAACRPSVNITTPPTAGRAKFTNYLAVGGNYTGGFMNQTLTVSGQLYSFPNLLFGQLNMVPPPYGANGPFVQPLLNSDNGYPGPKLVLGYTYNHCDSTALFLAPMNFKNFVADPIDAKPFVSTYNNGQINNIGVMPIRVCDYPVLSWALASVGPGYPYANRFYHNPAGTPLDELKYRVNNLYPTFVTVEMGMNDVLLYALNGGQGDGSGFALPVALNIYNPNDITPTAVFDTNYDKIINEATITGASGALLNVPDITALPYFHAIPIDGLTLQRQGQADTLAMFWKNAAWTKVFQPGANLFIIKDHHGNTRQAVPGELILMKCPLDSIRCAGWGSTTPIPDSLVLTTDEIQDIRLAVDAYNSFISFECTRHKLAYVDINAYFTHLSTGVTFNGITYNTEFVSNGAFSLDGIHPTQRGYALFTNEVIKAINGFYGSTVLPIDANKYKGIEFP
jgi:hypothetical protein